MPYSHGTKPEEIGDSSSLTATLNGTAAAAATATSVSANVNATATAEDKGHTFRKRRLSLTALKEVDRGDETCSDSTLQVAAAAAAAAATTTINSKDQHDANGYGYEDAAPPLATADAEDVKAHTFRKRRLSLTHNREDAADGDDVTADGVAGEHLTKRRRRASDASMSSIESGVLKSRTVHASELLAHPPLSPAILPRLYHQSAPPQGPNLLESIGKDGTTGVKWNKRHTRHLNEDERTLPFPRDVVGTFSCHGVEPIYDDDYLPEESDQEEEAWGTATTAQEKPTTAAKINQDRGGLAFPYGNCPKTALFAAYDGKESLYNRSMVYFSMLCSCPMLCFSLPCFAALHFMFILFLLGHGQGGELVSQFALHEVQRRLERHPDFTKDIEKAFKETFLAVDDALNHEAFIEPLYAGTTACVALLRDNNLIVSNVGDSRAVMARKTTQIGGDTAAAPTWQAIDLSKDQNPDMPHEQSRIESMGGFVSPPPEPGLSARVWLDVGCTQIGLAMSRSLGDHAVKQVGVIAEPVVTQHQVTEEDDFVILATDGVWEFISSDEAVGIVSENLHRGATKACQTLIEAAAAKWHDEEGDYRDDITALVIRLRHLWSSSSALQKSPQKNVAATP